MPYRGASPHCHVHIFGPQYHNAFFVDEDLSYRAIGSEVGFKGGISLKLGAVEGGYTSLGLLDIRRVLLEVWRDIHSRFRSREALDACRRSWWLRV